MSFSNENTPTLLAEAKDVNIDACTPVMANETDDFEYIKSSDLTTTESDKGPSSPTSSDEVKFVQVRPVPCADPDPIATYFTSSTRVRSLSPILSEGTPESCVLHKTADLFIKAKYKNGKTVLIEVVAHHLADESPVFGHMAYVTNKFQANKGPWIWELDDDANALKVLLGMLHHKWSQDLLFGNRTPTQLFNILMVSHKYELDHLYIPLARNWTRDHQLCLKDDGVEDVKKSLWIAMKLGDLRTFKEMARKIALKATVSSDGILCDQDGKVLTKDIVFPQHVLDSISMIRSEAVTSIYKCLSDPLAYLMTEGIPPNGRYCVSQACDKDCNQKLLGALISNLVQNKMYPVPEPKSYLGTVESLADKVDEMEIRGLVYPNVPMTQQRHWRCSLRHKEAVNKALGNCENDSPALTVEMVEHMKDRGRAMFTFDKKAFEPYVDQDMDAVDAADFEIHWEDDTEVAAEAEVAIKSEVIVDGDVVAEPEVLNEPKDVVQTKDAVETKNVVEDKDAAKDTKVVEDKDGAEDAKVIDAKDVVESEMVRKTSIAVSLASSSTSDSGESIHSDRSARSASARSDVTKVKKEEEVKYGSC